MLSVQDNEYITRVGRGTAMGNLMRQYWIPACLSSELASEGPPMRLLLLGERLIAFRDGAGQVGIMEHQCPHRCASLFFGRVEESGIRCIYHGWKFDVNGKCLEIPNVAVEPAFVNSISIKAYPTREHNGVVWIYMGERKDPPELPQIEALLLDADQVNVRCLQRNYNWLQGLEGDIDTSHFGFLHVGSVKNEDVDENNLHRFTVFDRVPKYHVKNTDWGTMYCGYRPADPGDTYYRFAHFLFPFWTLYPDGDFQDHIVAQAWVPMDENHTMVFSFTYTKRTMALRHRKDGAPIPGLEPDANNYADPITQPNSADWYGRWRTIANADNDYLVDRDAQRTNSYSGLSSVVIQDLAIVESMGAVTDRSREHLVASDAMVARTRRALLNAARALERDGTLPPLVENPSVSRAARSGSFIAPDRMHWVEAYVDQARKATSPTGSLTHGIDRFAANVSESP